MRDTELKFFRDILNERKKQIQKNIQSSLQEYDELNESELNDEADHASVNHDKLIEQAISEQQSKELDEIKYALRKIETGQYGICEMCEELISIPRLKVKPHAKYCITCREIVEKNSKER